jgi:hypothetical protein
MIKKDIHFLSFYNNLLNFLLLCNIYLIYCVLLAEFQLQHITLNLSVLFISVHSDIYFFNEEFIVRWFSCYATLYHPRQCYSTIVFYVFYSVVKYERLFISTGGLLFSSMRSIHLFSHFKVIKTTRHMPFCFEIGRWVSL